MDATGTPFSTLIRLASHERHTTVQMSPFMDHLLGGRLGVEAYARYSEELWFVYRALEDAAGSLGDDPVAGPFIRPELMRTAELERDLVHLRGADSRPEDRVPLPATAAYAARIKECARTWPAGYVAHHYTRYLGDLSGGQVLRDMAEKTWGFDRKGDGVRFYVFEQIPNPAAFKRTYRELLDHVEADDLEKQRMVEECRLAFDYNVAILRALEREFPLSA
ncbi:heme oxygenase (biliverdin-producing) [Streptomyces sp. NPDC096176]|uniref:biliverdin-producing heme oxygenase n=1 Tax=Streptomyces sp. NPDC096176 TaxID=3366079 RepID=UPI003802E641